MPQCFFFILILAIIPKRKKKDKTEELLIVCMCTSTRASACRQSVRHNKTCMRDGLFNKSENVFILFPLNDDVCYDKTVILHLGCFPLTFITLPLRTSWFQRAPLSRGRTGLAGMLRLLKTMPSMREVYTQHNAPICCIDITSSGVYLNGTLVFTRRFTRAPASLKST